MMVRTMPEDHRQPAEPSPEAQDAIASARHARVTSEAALPMAEQLRERVRSVLTANHFAELMEATLREAAARRLRGMHP